MLLITALDGLLNEGRKKDGRKEGWGEGEIHEITRWMVNK